MGIYDRDYYRGSTRHSLWLTGAAPVVKWLIILNVAVFVVELAAPGTIRWLRLEPEQLGHPHWQLWRLVTYAFCHDPAGILHILLNMLFLYWFGRELESMYGSAEFLRFYVAGAVVAGLSHLALCYVQDDWNAAIGASGAVLSVVFLYTLYYPRHQVWIFGLFPLEMRWLAVIYVAGDLLPILQGSTAARVAHAAHLGGAAYGVLYKLLDLRFSRLWGGRFSWPRRLSWPSMPWRRRPRIRVLVPPDEENLDQRVDQVLSKISREGAASLTDDERRTLEEASRRYKQRRP